MKKMIFIVCFVFAVTLFAKEEKWDKTEDNISISVNTSGDKVVIDGKLNSKDLGKAMQKAVKAIVTNENMGPSSKDIYIGPKDIVDDLVMVGGKAVVDGRVKGDVVVIGGRLIINEGAVIEGEIINIGGKIKNLSKGSFRTSFVSNFPDYILPGIFSLGVFAGLAPLIFLIWFGFVFSVILIIGIVSYYFIPKQSESVLKTLQQKPLLSFLMGFVGFLSFVPAILLLVLSILGISLIPLFVIFYFLVSAWGITLVMAAIGQKIPIKWERNVFINFLIGLVLVSLLSIIPFLGKLVIALSFLFGMGAVILSKFGFKA